MKSRLMRARRRLREPLTQVLTGRGASDISKRVDGEVSPRRIIREMGVASDRPAADRFVEPNEVGVISNSTDESLWVTGQRVSTGSFSAQEVRVANRSQNKITMGSQLREIPAMIERLRSDPELLSRIEGREAAFVLAMREGLANAVTHGNNHHPSRKIYVHYICEPDDSLSIRIRDEGNGFDPTDIPTPKNVGEDYKRGIHLMTSCMDEVQFRRNGTEVYMRMNGRHDSQA
jgi:anti-sigma regulatory factor (Ser/Thr protein kinase)